MVACDCESDSVWLGVCLCVFKCLVSFSVNVGECEWHVSGCGVCLSVCEVCICIRVYCMWWNVSVSMCFWVFVNVCVRLNAWEWVCCVSVIVWLCEHVSTCLHVCASACTWVWRPKADTKTLLFSTLFRWEARSQLTLEHRGLIQLPRFLSLLLGPACAQL